MASSKVLIAYQTKGGVTAEYAAIIAEVLREKHHLEVDVVDLAKDGRPDAAPYYAVIVGSGIRMGMWYGRAKRMLGHTPKEKVAAVYLASGRAGDPKQHQTAVEKYLTKVLAKKGIRPLAAEAFGGRMVNGGKVTLDNREPEHVRLWAEDVARKLEAWEQG